MKIAAIFDIHSIIAAPDAVLADIAHGGVDQVVNLGDTVSGALFPRRPRVAHVAIVTDHSWQS